MSASTPASSGCPFGGADCACATGPAPAVVALAAASWPAANAAPCGSRTTLATRRKETAGITIGIRGRIRDQQHARDASKNPREPPRGAGGQISTEGQPGGKDWVDTGQSRWGPHTCKTN